MKEIKMVNTQELLDNYDEIINNDGDLAQLEEKAIDFIDKLLVED